MKRKCGVESCPSDSCRREDKGVTFHKIPMHTDVRPKWMSLCRISEDKKDAKTIYVCSRHFLRADFCSFKGKKYMLKQGVLPSVFPWDKSKLEALKANVKKEYTCTLSSKCESSTIGNDDIKAECKEENLKIDNTELIIKKESLDNNVENNVIKTENETVEDTVLVHNSNINLYSNIKSDLESYLPSELTSEANDGIFRKEKNEDENKSDEKSDTCQSIKLGNKKCESNEFIKSNLELVGNVDQTSSHLDTKQLLSDVCKLEPGEKLGNSNSELNHTILELSVENSEPESNDNLLENHLNIKSEQQFDTFDKIKLPQTTMGSMNFALNSRIEALDFNNIWYPARIVEVDYEESEVLIHFEKFSSKYDEWISMNSSRLRPYEPNKKICEKYETGERCLASWSDARKFPATVTKVMDNDTYEVLFDDGFVKTLKGHRMSKSVGKSLQASPLFDPVKGSKQDRRDKKRKLNVAALFGKNMKRHRMDSTEKHKTEKTKPTIMAQPAEIVTPDTSFNYEESTDGQWHPTFDKHGKPVGTPSTIEMSDGIRKSVIVADPRLPEGWVKHLTRRITGNTAGKWGTIILGPDNRKFRSHSEIKRYLDQHSELGLSEELFDFSIYRNSRKKSCDSIKRTPKTPVVLPEEPELPPQEPVSEIKDDPVSEDSSAIKIIFENDSYKCPIEGCGKNFRRENLALMHVKHYHPTFSKFLDSTPNVADLAYARTVGESLDRSPGTSKPSTPKPLIKTSTPKMPKLPQSPSTDVPVSDSSHTTVPEPIHLTKDKEIIKLLNQKTVESADDHEASPPGVPTSTYPDIKIKDILGKTDDIPNRDDTGLKALCTSRLPSGIKTLLPVVRTEQIADESKQGIKRKRVISEPGSDANKGKSTAPQPPTHPPLSPLPSLPQPTEPEPHPIELYPPDSIIIEGGKIIKLERMKQEEIINCTCGFAEEDGLMIQCELCLCWQHAYCNNIQRESEVPEKYICWICQHPARERSSMKYLHDQEWLMKGTLPTASYHSKDEEGLRMRFEKLKKCNDLSGGLLELREYMHTLSLKLKIAEVRNHPKLYLWSKPWQKLPLPEKLSEIKSEKEDTKLKAEPTDQQISKNEMEADKQDNDSMLMMILKAGKDDDLNSLMTNNISAPIIPKPAAAIDPDDCRLNLLDHIGHAESLVEERLDEFERQIEALECNMNLETDKDYPKIRQTLELLMRDLDRLKEFSQVTML